MKDLSGKEIEDKYFNNSTNLLNDKKDIENDSNTLEEDAIILYNQLNNLIYNNDNENNEDFRKLFVEFILNCLSSSENCNLSYVGFPCSDKLIRKKMHELFKDNKYSKFIDTETESLNNITNLKLIAKHKRKSNNIPIIKRKRNDWPEGLGTFYL